MKTRVTTHQSPSLLEKIFLAGLVIIFGLIVVHAPLSVFVGIVTGGGLAVKAWKEIMIGGLLVAAAIIVTKRHTWGWVVRDRLIIACAALVLVYIVSVGYGHGWLPYGAGLLIDCRYILYAILIMVAVRLFPGVRPLMVKVGLAGAVIVVGFGLLQFVLPKDFLSILGYSSSTITPYTTIDSDENLPRLQSTLRGPNPLGAYALIVTLAAAVYAVKSRVTDRKRIGLAVLSLTALIVLIGSYSRSAYIGVAVGALIAGAVILGRKGVSSRKVIVGAIVGLAVLVAGFAAVRGTAFYANVVEHNVAGSGPEADSNAGHSASLTEGWRRLLTHPLGYGTGSTGSASLLGSDGYIVENQYLYVAHEAGWVALGLFAGIVCTLLGRAFRNRRDPLALGVFASGIGLLIVGLLLPVFADDTVAIVWFGLAALVAMPPEEPSGRRLPFRRARQASRGRTS